MIARCCRWSWWIALCATVVWIGPAPIFAQEKSETSVNSEQRASAVDVPAAASPQVEPAEATPPAKDKPLGAQGDENASAAPSREQSIYIPYEKLRQVFEKQGRGVFLPYEEFDRLWKAAREQARPPKDEKPPVGALVTEIDNEATVEKDVVRVKATLKIEVLAEGWSEVPLRLADAAITRATIDGQPARIVGAPGQDYKLLVENKGREPQTLDLELSYAKAITRLPGQNSVSFQAPQAPVSRWKVIIPQEGVKVNVFPHLATTEESPAGDAKNGPKNGPKEQTVVLAFVGAAPVVRIDWTPKAEGAMGLAALASVQAEQQVWINEGVTRTRAVFSYTISRAELPQLTIEAPDDQKVVNVFDDNVRQWSVEQIDGKQRITAQLFEPAKNAQKLTVELEKFVQDQDQFALSVPVVKALNVGRQQGMVVVNVASGLRAEATMASGLLQVDRSELPASLKGGEWAFAYRYATVPFELTLDVEKVQPRVLADSLVEVYLEPEKLTVDVTASLSIERSGLFRIEFDIPEDCQVRQVRGRELPPAGELPAAAAVQVDTYHVEGEKKNRLVVNLSKRATGRVGLAIELVKELADRDLLAEPGKTAELVVAFPRITGAPVERSVGRLLLYAPESLRVNPKEVKGLGDLTFDKALEGMPPARDRAPGDGRPVLAFSFADAPTTLSLAVERRKPQVTIEQLLVMRIESGVVRYEATFTYDVRYSGVKSLRIDVPEEVSGQMRNETPGVSERKLDPQPDDVADKFVAWSLSGESEFLGGGAIRLVWEKKLEKLEVATPAKIDVPRLKPRGVDRAWGRIAITKAEALDVSVPSELEGLTPIDPQFDLKPPMPDAARALEFHGEWSLPVTVTQYEMEDVKRTSIERGVLQMVVTPAGELSVRALYRMRSARQRLELTLDGEAEFAAAPLRINGKSVSLERGKPGQFFVPLVGSNADEPFVLELRYTVRDDGGRLRLPAFPHDAAALKVYLCVYLPKDRTLLGTTGAWQREQTQWWLDPWFKWRPVPVASPDELVRWVAEGIDVAGSLTDSFQTDGSVYVFSTLSPAPSPHGDLRVYSMPSDWLHALVILVVVLGGLLLLPSRAATRATTVGTLIVLVVLAGVFWPTFARQVLDGVFLAAIVVVLVLWIAWFFVRTQPRLAAQRAAARAATPPPPPPTVPQPPTKPLGQGGAGIDLTKQPSGESPSAEPRSGESADDSKSSPKPAGEEGEEASHG